MINLINKLLNKKKAKLIFKYLLIDLVMLFLLILKISSRQTSCTYSKNCINICNVKFYLEKENFLILMACLNFHNLYS